MWDRKEYDRQRARREYEKYKARRAVVVGKLGGCCYLCSGKHKVYNLHHVKYHETESNYPRHSKSMYIRLKRLAEAERSPERFKLLCQRCHRLVEMLRYKKAINSERLIELLLVL